MSCKITKTYIKYFKDISFNTAFLVSHYFIDMYMIDVYMEKRFDIIEKIPSEMEVAPLHNGFFELSNYWVSQ